MISCAFLNSKWHPLVSPTSRFGNESFRKRLFICVCCHLVPPLTWNYFPVRATAVLLQYCLLSWFVASGFLINNKAALTSLLYCLIVWCLVKLETNQSWVMPECLNILSRHNRKYFFYILMPFINVQASFISTYLQMMINFFYRHRDISILRMADCWDRETLVIWQIAHNLPKDTLRWPYSINYI